MSSSLTIAFYTLGCKVNFTETSGIAKRFSELGFSIVKASEKADIYVINTCTVTSTADKKSRAVIRQVNKKNPQAYIVVTGCFSQLKAEEIAQLPGVTLVTGNAEKENLTELVVETLQNHRGKVKVSDIQTEERFFLSWSQEGRTRCFLKIQDGCDYRCAYCTVPAARGHSRSATIKEVIEAIYTIQEKDFKEIVLTGVNTGDFGKKNGESFFQLLNNINQLPFTVRIRLSSIEPDLINENLIHLIAESDHIMPHFHIPVQSACNQVLKLMGRRYTTDYLNNIFLSIKKHIPHACIACDVITGFPGETDENFQETFAHLSEWPISYLHVFTYSERSNTKALQLRDRVPERIRKERTLQLLTLSKEKEKEFYQSQLGSKSSVLFESSVKQGILEGFTENYLLVKTPFQSKLINQIVEAELRQLHPDNYFIINT